MIKKIIPSTLATTALHRFILGAVAPRPIAFVSTVDAQGNSNLSPFSFFNAFGVNPTTLIFSPSRRGRDNTTKHTYQNIKEVPEVVINVVNYDIVQQASLASTEYAKGVNEFIKAGFTPLPSETIRPFRVKESPVQFECKVRQVIETGDGGGAANLVICEITMIHVHENILDENDTPDANKIRLVGRHTGDYYVKAFGESLFKVAKPLMRLGMGIDQLPEHIRLSKILTGNHLGQLGNIETMPEAEDIKRIRQSKDVKLLFKTLKDESVELEYQLHRLAQQWLDDGRAEDALALLMIEIPL
ncbi:MAG TPA: flavin reductase family protein [Bacteroidales bacterium]|nr:flavin reductase family protein [Bacteroidales bacterium]